MKKEAASPLEAKQPPAFLVNATRRRVLAQEGRVLRGLATGIGAMFRGLPGSFVLVWHRPARISITNLFVPEDLDLLWLDDAYIVVDLCERFPAGAWRTINENPARYVVELPAGTIAASGSRTGDRIACTGLPASLPAAREKLFKAPRRAKKG